MMDELLEIQGHNAISFTDANVALSSTVKEEDDYPDENTIVDSVDVPDSPKKKSSRTCWVCELEKRDQRTYDANDVIFMKESKFGKYDKRYPPDIKISKSGEIQILSRDLSPDEISEESECVVECKHSLTDSKSQNGDTCFQKCLESNKHKDLDSETYTNEQKTPSLIQLVMDEVESSLKDDIVQQNYDSNSRRVKSIGSINVQGTEEKRSEMHPSPSLYSKTHVDDGFKPLEPPVSKRARDLVSCSLSDTATSDDFLPVVDM